MIPLLGPLISRIERLFASLNIYQHHLLHVQHDLKILNASVDQKEYRIAVNGGGGDKAYFVVHL